jgi:hypothetical protein
MIIFPLIITWMWFQIFTASPLRSSGVPLRAALTLTPLCFLSECHLNEVEHNPGLFPPLQTDAAFNTDPVT